MKRKTFITLLLLATVLFAFVSCNDNVVPEDRTGAIFLGNNERSIGTAVTYTDDVENLYWYYKATKNDDGYTTGATDGYVSVVKDSSGSPTKGLSGKTLASNGFSYGYWNIELRGYSSTSDSTTKDNAKYTASITNFLVKDSMNYATVEIKVGDGATTSIVFDDIWFSADNITGSSTFALTITDTDDATTPKTKGTVTVSTANDDISLESGRVTFKNITYSADADKITGNHVMTFALVQTLKPSTGGTDADSTAITVAVYTLAFNVLKGTTTTISGDMLKSDKTGDIQINGSLSVPATTLKKVIPVEDGASDESATVKTATSISIGDLTVTYPVGAVIVPGDGGYTGEDGNITSDGSVGFTYVDDSNPTGEGISIEVGESSAKYELTLNAGTDANGTTKNEKLIEIKKYLGLNLNITKIYHGTDLLTTTESENNEYYKYDASTGYLYLYVFHASDFYIITKTPEKYVAQVGTAKYTNANAAFNDAKKNDGKVTILDDCTVERDELPNGVDFDINGKTITVTYNTGKEETTKVAESTFNGNSTALKYFAGGQGTSSDPFQIADKEQFQNITNMYDEYAYYRLSNEYTDTDLTGWVPVKLHGSFDGNKKQLTNVTACLFDTVGYKLENEGIVLTNFDATLNISSLGTYGTGSLVKNIFNSGTTTFENINIHGKIDAYFNIGSFYSYGTANYDDRGASYTASFKNCTSDATLICTTGNTGGGFVGHGYEGAGNALTLSFDENCSYTGKFYTTGGNGYAYIGMWSSYENTEDSITIGKQTYKGSDNGCHWAADWNKYNDNNNITITQVTPTLSSESYTVPISDNVSYIIVSVNAQLTAYGEDGSQISNMNGITLALGNEKKDSVSEKVSVLDKVTSAIIDNSAESYGYSISNNVMTINVPGNSGYQSGTVRLTVAQYKSNGDIVAAGTINLCTIEKD